MKTFREVTWREIARLDDRELTRLLKILLHQEALSYNIATSSCTVPLDITVPDGGEDGRIQWEGGVDNTNFIPRRFTSFQVKTEEMGPAIFATHFLQPGGKRLKPRVAEVLDGNGSYIVFYGRRCGDRAKSVLAVRTTLKNIGRTDAETAILHIYDGERIADWTNRYPTAILYVRHCMGQSLPRNLQSWESCSEYKGW